MEGLPLGEFLQAQRGIKAVISATISDIPDTIRDRYNLNEKGHQLYSLALRHSTGTLWYSHWAVHYLMAYHAG